MRERGRCCCCFAADTVYSQLCLPKFLPPPFSRRQLKDPLPVAQRSSFIWVLRSPVSLCRPDVSATSCKREHLRDERAIHYRITPRCVNKGSLSQLPSLHTHTHTHSEIHTSWEAGKWMLTTAFVRGKDNFQTFFGQNCWAEKSAECICSVKHAKLHAHSSTESCQCHLKLKCSRGCFENGIQLSQKTFFFPPVSSLWGGGDLCLSI